MSPDRAPENASLPAKDERGMALLAAMADAPTEAERGCRREAVIRYYLPDATGLVHRFRHRGVPNDDLHQVAAMALVMAVDRFDPARGKPFIGFLISTVLGEIRRYFRDRTWAVWAPRALQERCLAITNATDRLAQQLGRSPTVKDLARELDLTVDEVLEGLECGWAASTPQARSPDPPTTTGSFPLPPTGTWNWSRTGKPCNHSCGNCQSETAASCECGSSTNSPKPRSPNKSASHKCTYPGS
jgi:RNA polymerase sigma factor (sigma-70 family)